MIMEISGKIIHVLPVSSGISQRTGNKWTKQTYVLETQEQYPKKIPFEVFGEERINNFAIKHGETITISFDIDANEWNGKWFAKVSCFKVKRDGQQQSAQPAPAAQPSQQYAAAPPQPSPAPAAPTEQPAQNDGGGDLPF